jgi:hypothetical protein
MYNTDMRKRLLILIIGLAILAALGAGAFAFRVALKDAVYAASKPKLPPAAPYVAPSAPKVQVPSAKVQENPKLQAPKPEMPPAPSNVKSQTSKVEAQELNLAVPFTPQAPHANWDLPYQEACEEASAIMAAAYFSGESSFTPEEADRRILKLVEWEKARFGYYEDTTAAETAAMLREYFGLSAEARPVASIDEIKKPLLEGRLVILPAAGRLLKNPYFRGQGPLYHMLVVKGFTKDGRIITNDPGTRRGADFVYDPATLWNAVHDWNGGKVAEGAKLMIVVAK